MGNSKLDKGLEQFNGMFGKPKKAHKTHKEKEATDNKVRIVITVGFVIMGLIAIYAIVINS